MVGLLRVCFLCAVFQSVNSIKFLYRKFYSQFTLLQYRSTDSIVQIYTVLTSVEKYEDDEKTPKTAYSSKRTVSSICTCIVPGTYQVPGYTVLSGNVRRKNNNEQLPLLDFEPSSQSHTSQSLLVSYQVLYQVRYIRVYRVWF